MQSKKISKHHILNKTKRLFQMLKCTIMLLISHLPTQTVNQLSLMHQRLSWNSSRLLRLKPGFHYPSTWAVLTARQLGQWKHVPVNTTRQLGLLTQVVNSGSGNLALVLPICSGTLGHQLQSLATLFAPLHVTTACRSSLKLACLTSMVFLVFVCQRRAWYVSSKVQSPDSYTTPYLTKSVTSLFLELHYWLHENAVRFHDSSDSSLMEYIVTAMCKKKI